MNLLPTNSPGGYFDCQLSAHFPGSSAGSCRVPALYTPSTGGTPAFKPGPHVHPITDTQAVSTTWRLFWLAFFHRFTAISRRFSCRFLHVAAAIFLLRCSHPPIFAAISHHFPTGSPVRFLRHLSATSRDFCRNFPRFSASPVAAAVFSCAAAAKDDSAPNLSPDHQPRTPPRAKRFGSA